jgi:hypothetical protein
VFIFNRYVKRAELGSNGEGGDGSGGTPPANNNDGEDDLKTQFAKLQEENASMKNKMTELLGETKRAKQLQRNADDLVAQEKADKAKAAGDFEQLFKSSEDKVLTLTEELKLIKDGVSSDKRKSAVMTIARELSDGDDAENLAALIENRLKYHDGELKVLDKNGQLTVSSLEDFKAEIKSTPRFKSLLKGSQATGGSANGNRGSTPNTKTVTRAEFDSMNHNQRSKHFSTGGTVS